jgi:hypothetical protein
MNYIALKIKTHLTLADKERIAKLNVSVDDFIRDKFKKCQATTRLGKPCQKRALNNRTRCWIHGGKSTGPKSEEGKKKALANLLKSHRRQGISKK